MKTIYTVLFFALLCNLSFGQDCILSTTNMTVTRLSDGVQVYTNNFASGPVNVCPNQSYQVSITTASLNGTGHSFSWTSATGTISSTSGAPHNSSTVTINFPSSAALNVSVTGSTSCTASTASININTSLSPPTLSISSPASSICQGGSTTLTASCSLNCGTGFVWNNGSTNTSISVNPTNTSSFSVSSTNINGCSGSSSITVTVNDTAAITSVVTSNGSSSFCDNADPILQVNLGAGAGTSPTYVWSRTETSSGGSGNNSNAASGSSTSTTMSLLNAGTYNFEVTVTNNNTCTSRKGINGITINPLPSIASSFSSGVSVCEGSTVSIPVTSPSAGHTFLWSNGGQTTATATFIPSGGNVASPGSTSVTYVVTVTNTATSCVNTSSFGMNVYDTIIVTSPATYSICAGQSQVIALAASGSPNFLSITTINWSGPQPGTSSGSPSGITYTTPNLNVNRTYTAQITRNSAGNSCVSNFSVSVTVNANPTAVISVGGSAVSTTNTCVGSSVSLVASGGTTYSWGTMDASYGAGPTNTSTVSVTPTADYTYTVTVGSGGCSSSTTVLVDVRDRPSVSIPGGQKCDNVAFTLIPVTNGTNFLWSNGSTSNQITVSPPFSAGTYSLTVTDGSSCNGFGSVTITPITCGNIFVNATGSNSSPTTLSGVNYICGGQVIELGIVGNNYSLPVYAWETGESSQNIFLFIDSCVYDLVLTDTYGDGWDGASLTAKSDGAVVGNFTIPRPAIFVRGTISRTFQIKVPAGKTVSFDYSPGIWENENDYTINENGNVIYRDGFSVLPPYVHVGYPRVGTDVFSNTCEAITEDSIDIAWESGHIDTITFTELRFFCRFNEVNFTFNCSIDTIQYRIPYYVRDILDTFTVLISRPRVELSPSDTIVCYGTSLPITANCYDCLLALDNNSIQWNGNSIPSTTFTLNNVTSLSNVLFEASDLAGCYASVSTTVTPIPDVGALINPPNPAFCPTGSTTLTASATNCTSCTYLWTTGQSGSSITVNQQGPYAVTVTENGCTDIAAVTVTQRAVSVPVIVDSVGVNISGTTLPRIFLCNGDPVTVFVDTTGCFTCSYTWNNGSNGITTNVNTQGGVFVRVQDQFGCIGYSNTVLAVNSTEGSNPVATSNKTSLCPGENATLSVSGCPNCNYTWYNNASPTVVLSNSRQFSTTVSGDYFALVTNIQSGCAYVSNPVFINNATVTQPSISASADSICNGSSTRLITPYNSQFQYQWYSGTNVLSFATDTFLNVNAAMLTGNLGNFHVDVIYPNGCMSSSNSVTITNYNFNPTISSSNPVICPGESVSLSTQNALGWTYQWYKNGVAINGANASVYQATSEGTFYVRVTNNNLCSANTNSIFIGTSSVSAVNIFTNKTEICPGDSARLSITLCAGCSYEWFNAATGASLNGSSSPLNYSYTVFGSGTFYAKASNQFCDINSDTLSVTLKPVVTPPINTSSNFVCNGQTSTLLTSGCTGCIYTWIRNNSQIFGALSDTVFVVSNTADAGDYMVLVRYPNGCSDTSAVLNIADGSYNIDIKIDSTAGDSVVCNQSAVVIEIDSVNSSTLSFCSLGCNFQWFENSTPIIPSNTARYNTSIGNTGGGFYKLVMVDSRGCREESNLLQVNEVNLSPNIISNATSICGNSSILLSYPDSSSCSGCTYEWQKSGSAASTVPGPITNPSYITEVGAAAVGVYSLEVTQSGCVALSNLISLNQIAGLSIPIISTDLNICNGDTTTIFRTGGGCTNCQFQWLNNNVLLPGATTPSLTVSSPGNYSLEMTIGTTGCRDTSATVTLLPVPSPIDSFSLSASVLTPLTGTGPIVNLHGAIFPPTVSVNDTFYSQPFNAALGLNSGLSGADNEFMNPSQAGAGFHRIYYRYDSLGCRFIYNDILYIFDDPSIGIINENPTAPQFEACVADTIQLQVSNLPFNIANVFLYDVNNVYTPVPLNSNSLSFSIFGLDTVWNGTIRMGIPDWAQPSFILVTSATNLDSFITPFVLIHNTNLDFNGLPSVICSNASPITLSGIPAGGFFKAEYNSGSTLAPGTVVTNAFNGSDLVTSAMTSASYGTDQIQNIRVVYNFVNTYTNGLNCPQIDTISKIVQARAVFLDSVKYNPIAASQNRELLENLVFRVYPYAAQPSQWATIGTFGFNGNFTFPAGNPLDFLPKNAGIGKHAMSYSIQNGTCINSKTDSINVIAAPNPIGIPDSICRSQTFANFGRQLGLYSYFDGPNIPILPTIFFSDTINVLKVSTSSPGSLVTINTTTNLELYNYNPLAVVGNHDTLKVEYWYKKIERIAGVPVDTVQYVVGSVVIPIFIDDQSVVEIIDTIVNNFYCEENQLYLLAGSPSGGVFSLRGGTGTYANGAVLQNNILNPFDIHSPESTNTTYMLTYIKQDTVCLNSDSMQITIPEPLNPTFTTSSGRRVFCQTEPTQNVVINTTGNFSAVWLINGVSQQPPYLFSPSLLNPGNQVVTHLVTDNAYNCVYTAVDSFKVNPLPVLTVNPILDTAYCTNDPIVTIQVSPDPICPAFIPQTMLFEGFESLTFPWVRESTGAGNPWIRSTGLPFSGVSSAMVTTSNDVQNAWMFSPNLNLTTGQSYRVTVFAAAGNCTSPGCLPAAFRVRLSQGQSILTHSTPTTVLVADTTISQTFYQPYSFNYTHAAVSGNYNFSFHCYSGIGARSLLFDNITIANTSVQSCASGGQGSLNGQGITYISDSTYTFNPQVVTPGNYSVTYVYTDAATGCTDSIPMPVRIKAHPRPTMTNLAGQYCDNAGAIPLQGLPLGGVFSSNGPNLVMNQSVASFDPDSGFVNEIVSYTYTDLATQCVTTVSDTTTILSIVDSARISNINNLGYCVNVDSVVLSIQSVAGTPGVGAFFGAGVRNGIFGPRFYPDSAFVDSGRYRDFTITYIYPTTNGCVDTTRAVATVHAMPELSFDLVADSIRLPDSICLNAGITQVRVNNHLYLGPLGNIEIDTMIPIGPVFVGGGTFVPYLGFQDTLNPVNFGPGWHQISYSYTDFNGCSSTIRDSFRVDSVPVIRFDGLQPDRIYCENDAPSLLLAYPPYYPGSGYLQLTSGIDSFTVDSSFYLLNPTTLTDVNNSNRVWNIYYTFKDLNNCVSFDTTSIVLRPYPRLNLNIPATFCSAPGLEPLMPYVSPTGGVFSDTLPVSGIVNNMLNLAGPSGLRKIIYYYTDTISTCSNSDFQYTTLYNTPEVDFYALGGCVGQPVRFVADSTVNNLISGLDNITGVEWIFGDGNSVSVVPANPIRIPDQTYSYTNDGVYQVRMVVDNQGFCRDTVTQQLVVSPTINYTASTPYVENFQNGPGGWYQEQEVYVPDSLAIWQRALLVGNNINDAGNFAWVTRPNAPYTYGQDERAWVYSPCFDFSDSKRPMIVMKVWRDFLTDIDGAVLEYYDDNRNKWTPLGEVDKGINWYQTNFLVSRPGNQDTVDYPRGWTGKSRGWDQARYRLDNLATDTFVRFRVAFASDINTVIDPQVRNEGMAFDSVWIGERGRNVLLEHFSNYYHVSQQGAIMDVIDQYVYDTIYNRTNGQDVSLIQYQTDIAELDPINAQYSVDFDARVLYYGINANSQMRVDGLSRGNGRSEDIKQTDLDYDMLQFPVFDLDIANLTFSGNTVQAAVTARALANLDSSDYSLTIAITEDEIYNDRGFPMSSVLRKFLPDATGYSYVQRWTTGQTVSHSTNWIYDFGTLNPSKLQGLVYIQDNATKDVLQVATTRDLTIFAPIGTIPVEDDHATRNDLNGLNLFPNPAHDYFNVRFENELDFDYNWSLTDMLGRSLRTGKAESGTAQLSVETNGLSEGTYLFVIQNKNALAQRKVVITRRN